MFSVVGAVLSVLHVAHVSVLVRGIRACVRTYPLFGKRQCRSPFLFWVLSVFLCVCVTFRVCSFTHFS